MRKFELKRVYKMKEPESVSIYADSYVLEENRIVFQERVSSYQVNQVGSFEISNDNIISYEVTSIKPPFDADPDNDLTEML